jgi:predicted SnoaL-like aldol condensation-catalyzing enzyme
MCCNDKDVPLIAGLCERHYWDNNRRKSAAKFEAKRTGQEGKQTVIDDLDAIFSQVVRLSYADEHGMVECYTCGAVKHWKHMQCGHFIPRIHMFTRFSEDNTKPQCPTCNILKDGNLVAFAQHLERDRPGAVEMLEEQANNVYHYDIDELKAMIGNCAAKKKQLLKNIYQ